MLLTNLGAELAKERIMRYRRKMKEWNCTKEGKKQKFKKRWNVVQRDWLTRSRQWYVDIASFWSRYGKGTRLFFTYSLTGRLTSFPLPCFTLLFPFTLPTLPYFTLFFPFSWDNFNLNSLLSFFNRKYSKTFPNCV